MMQHQDINRAVPSLTTRCVQHAEEETMIAPEPKTDPTLWSTKQSQMFVPQDSQAAKICQNEKTKRHATEKIV